MANQLQIDPYRFDVYDALRLKNESDRRALTAGRCRLFGSTNIGQTHLCNLQVPGMLLSDRVAHVRSFYARTNIFGPWNEALSEAFVEWSNVTTATLVVGEKPLFHQPLSDLIIRCASPIDHEVTKD